MNHRRLIVWLDDHAALLTGAIALLDRFVRENEGERWAPRVEKLRGSFEGDRARVVDLLARLDAEPSPVKDAVLRLGEMLGRLKPNAQLTGYSPLSRAEELEALTLATQARVLMWAALGRTRIPLPDDDFRDRERRAREELLALQKLHMAAAEEAMAT